MTPLQSIQKTMATLDKEERCVLSSLYGLGGVPRHPLEDIGNLCGLSVGVVAEVEARAIRKLRHPVTRKVMMQALADGEQQIWDALSLSTPLVFKKDIPSKLPERLPGEYQIAIKCILGTVDLWLSNHSCETPKAWYRGPYPCEDFQRLIARLDSIHNEMRMPTPLQFLEKTLQVENDILLLAAALANFCAVYRGYFSKSSMGIRVARAIHLHQLISFAPSSQPITTAQLVALYNERHPDDPIGFDEAEVVLDKCPHLFLPMGFQLWCGIEPIQEDLSDINCGTPPTPPEVDGRVLRHLRGREQEQQNPRADAQNVLHEILAIIGPSDLRDIAAEFDSRMGDTNKHQILKEALAQSAKVVTLAPEVFALHEHLSCTGDDSNFSRLLTTARQCRIYAVSRRAGEPMGAWPLWTPKAEQDMCCWAEQNASQDLFKSLLAVADPQSWEDRQAVKNIWSFKKQCFGRFCLDRKLKASTWEKTPSLVQVFCAAARAKQLGYINWLRIQEIIGLQLYTRLYEQDSAPVLAILIGLRMVGAPAHWQAAHQVAPELDATFSILSHELHKTGALRWAGAIGQELIFRLEAACKGSNLGWVDSDALVRLCSTLTAREARPPSPFLPDEDETLTTCVGEKPLRQLRLPFRNPSS